MRASKLYLAAYNAASIAGWAYVILQIVQHFIAHRENPAAAIPTLYKHIEQPLKIVQTAAVLEIFHAMFGLVRAALFTTIVQGMSCDGQLRAQS
jgi:very-long-chain (3R)-3-hydroxyacyl-CoA dehydratase